LRQAPPPSLPISTREQWNIDPGCLRESPIDGVQYRERNASIHSSVIAQRLERVGAERSLDRGIDRGLSIEL
jgi:hypothetical protein